MFQTQMPCYAISLVPQCCFTITFQKLVEGTVTFIFLFNADN